MSQYSEIMGSFIRTGDFPIEANYIFPNEQALKDYCQDSLNKTTLHKGLLKIVESDENGQQALYWVIQNPDTQELEFSKVISNNSIINIDEILKNKADLIDGTVPESQLPPITWAELE